MQEVQRRDDHVPLCGEPVEPSVFCLLIVARHPERADEQDREAQRTNRLRRQHVELAEKCHRDDRAREVVDDEVERVAVEVRYSLANLQLASDRAVDPIEKKRGDEPHDRGTCVTVDHRVQRDESDDHAARRQGVYRPGGADVSIAVFGAHECWRRNFHPNGIPERININPVSVHTMAEQGRRGSLPAYVVGLATAVVVLFIGLLSQHLDGSAAIFTGGYLHIGVALGWLLCAGLTALVVTRHWRIAGVVDEGPGLAVAYDALPILLLLAWFVLIAALLTEHWLLAAIAGALAIYHLLLVVPRLLATRVPRWAKHAPRLEIVVANVFIDNKTPEAAARQLVEADVDVVIIVESTAPFMTIFDEVGGKDTYPFRVSD